MALGIGTALIGAGASVLGGLIGSKGQADANKANLKIAREQMDFQERMSSTAYQRAAGDLESAGLNRILALGSPASTPGGAKATMLNEAAALGEGIADAPASAMALKMQQEQIHLMYSQAGAADATAHAQTEKARLDHRTREQMDTVQRQLEATIRETTARTGVHTADAAIRATQADMYELLGPALLAVKEMLPVGSAAALGLGAIINKISNRRKGRQITDQSRKRNEAKK